MRKRNFSFIGQRMVTCVVFLFSGWLVAQDPAFTAKVSSTTVAQHSVFSVQFELENANGKDFSPPSFGDFKVVAGPATSSSTMIVNGTVTQRQSWTYSLLATKQGKYTLQGATIVAGRKKLKANPIPVQVVEPSNLSNQNATSEGREPIYLKAEVNGTSFYPGQQIVLTYNLLFRENVQTVSTMAEEDYADFFVQGFSNFSRDPKYVTVNNLQFTSRIIKSLALFAHQSGTYTIDPMVMSVGINAPFQGSQSFFGMRRMHEVQTASEAITIKVKPLPSDTPDSFSGAVGQYKMQLFPEQTEISTGDALSFQLELKGNGDSRRWAIPSPVADGSFEMYDPKIQQENSYDNGNELSYARTIQYQMIPAEAGTYKVYVPFTFFDPETNQYVTLHSDTMKVVVAQGEERSSAKADDEKNTFEPELMPIGRQWLKDEFWTSVPHGVLLALLLAASGFGLFVEWKRRREAQIPEAVKVQRASGSMALQKFAKLEEEKATLPSNIYFERATEIYYTFLLERFTIPSAELSEDGITTHLSKANIEHGLLERVVQFFTQCLTVRYGGTPGGLSREAMLQECREQINLLEQRQSLS